MIMMYHRVKRN